MSPLVFRYSLPFAVVATLGIPVVGVVSMVLVAVSIYGLADRGLSILMRLDEAVVGLLGVAGAYVCVMAVRTLYSLFTTYIVSADGIKVRYFNAASTLEWHQLKAARYRKLAGQLELRFDGFGRIVVLGNVDLNPTRRTVLAGLALVQSKSPWPVKQTAL